MVVGLILDGYGPEKNAPPMGMLYRGPTVMIDLFPSFRILDRAHLYGEGNLLGYFSFRWV